MDKVVQRLFSILLFSWHLAFATTATAADCTPQFARIFSVQGEIEVKRAGASNWHSVNRNDTFCPGDSIRVGEHSRAAIVMANETLLRLDQNSAIKFTQFETELPSILEFIKGIGHFISRVPRSLKIETATMDAAVEGTEFVVAVSAGETSVTVFEGTVLTHNPQGEIRITDGETAIATVNAAPRKTLLARPRDTVQWAVYFPPVIEMDKTNDVSRASRLLYVGRVEEAQSLLQGMDSGEALALQTVIAIVNNEQASAFNFATDAVRRAPQSAATHIALSYAWQAKLDLNQALDSARQAVELETDNAIAWARLAELQLSTGELNEALASAQQAIKQDATLSRTQSILGYAYLARIDIDEAMAAFSRAIELNQVDPLPRLGLGLGKIRKGKLDEGRREIEIATSLDPNNAIIRSYLGKAYFDERRAPLDAEQFSMSKELDPNDPTPYFYDAIRRQTENDPVGALENLNRSIDLNDNRAVYRSSLLLDKDGAARSASLARIYQDLGFDELAAQEASKSLEQDPANSSALRFLSDSFKANPRHEIARASALLQSQLLQPLNATPVQPRLRETNLNLISIQGPGSTGFNEFNPLFTKNQINITADAVAGSNNLLAGEVVLSGLYDRVAFSLGQFYYDTDGWRENADVDHDITNAFIQVKASKNLDIQFEYINRSTDQGDLRMSLEPPPEFQPTNRGQLDEETARFGLNYVISPASNFIFSYVNNQRKANTLQGIAPLTFQTSEDPRSDNYELQYLFNSNTLNLVAGAGTNSVDGVGNITVLFDGVPLPESIPLSLESEQYNAYVYNYISLNSDINLTLGLSYDDIERESPKRTTEELNPKLGLTWDVSQALRLRLAAFGTVKRNLVANQTLEPTEIAGFVQFYDDINDSESTVYGLGVDGRPSSQTFAGLELTQRDLDIPETGDSMTTFNSQEESRYKLYLNWLLTRQLALSMQYIFEEIKNDFVDPTKLETTTAPLSLTYSHPSGFFSSAKFTHVDQEGQYEDPVLVNYADKFNLVDLLLGYRLPRRHGFLSLQVNNIFDETFTYQDYSVFRNDIFNFGPQFIPERNIYARITLNF
ncbi:MAG: FecR domain-containing protein [Gammaproteobacteria bacterium]